MKKLLMLVVAMAFALSLGAPMFAAPSAQSGLNPVTINARKKKHKKKKKNKKKKGGMMFAKAAN